MPKESIYINWNEFEKLKIIYTFAPLNSLNPCNRLFTARLREYSREKLKINLLKGKCSMLNQYETVFIATPVLSEAQFKEVVSKFSGLITANNGELIHDEDWGLKKLAYPIQKKSTGFYHLIEFKAEPSFIEKLETEYRRDERIIRFLTFKLDKHAVEYSEKRRIKVKAKAEEK